MWNVSTAVRGYLRLYMPSNIVLELLHTRRGLMWAIPVALVVVPGYLLAMSICAAVVADGGHGWLNVLVILFFWDALKFAWMASLSPLMLLKVHGASFRRSAGASKAERATDRA